MGWCRALREGKDTYRPGPAPRTLQLRARAVNSSRFLQRGGPEPGWDQAPGVGRAWIQGHAKMGRGTHQQPWVPRSQHVGTSRTWACASRAGQWVRGDKGSASRLPTPPRFNEGRGGPVFTDRAGGVARCVTRHGVGTSGAQGEGITHLEQARGENTGCGGPPADPRV